MRVSSSKSGLAAKGERCKVRSLMIQSLQIKNFRCFKNVEIENLGLINVVVGKNAAGKTALLEAIFLPSGGPELPINFRGWRGAGGPVFPIQTRAAYEANWADLFLQFNSDLTIEVKLSGTPENSRSVKIFYDRTRQAQVLTPGVEKPPIGFSGVPGEGRTPPSDSTTIIPLVFEVIEAEGKPPQIISADINPQGFFMVNPPSPRKLPITFFYLATLVTNPSLSANLFGDLSSRNEEPKFVESFKKVFPQVSDLTSLSPTGSPGGLYVTLPKIPRKMPLGLISGGMQKLAGILLGIATRTNGAVLVDEIEDGFHHTVFPKVWESTITLCKEYKTQLFASSHSAEFMTALEPFIRENPSDFRLLRVEDDHTVRAFKGKDFEAALETGTEIR